MRILLGLVSVLAICVAVGCSDKDEQADQPKSGDNAAVEKNADPGKAAGDDSAKSGGKRPPSNDLAPTSIAIIPENTEITFTGTNSDGKLSGGFKAVEGTVQLADGPTTIDLRIESNSLFTADEKLANQLKSEGLFEVISFPKVSLMSSKIEPASSGDVTHTLTADLMLRGETNSVTAPLQFESTADRFTLTMEFTISGKDFGFATKPETIDDAITIRIKIDASQK